MRDRVGIRDRCRYAIRSKLSVVLVWIADYPFHFVVDVYLRFVVTEGR